MLYCNLSGLMAAKKVNISEVSRDTGISRTTLTGLYYNDFKGIQNDTLDTLCRYFDVTVDKILLFSRYDIKVYIDSIESDSIKNINYPPDMLNVCICIEVSSGQMNKTIKVAGELGMNWYPRAVDFDLRVEYYDPNDEEDEKNIAFFKKVFSTLPYEITAFINDKIENAATDYYIDHYRALFDNRETSMYSHIDLKE